MNHYINFFLIIFSYLNIKYYDIINYYLYKLILIQKKYKYSIY